jgi:hypothetical protein
MAHGTRIGGMTEGGFGPGLEFALGRGRVQYVAEASLATAGFESWHADASDQRIDGWQGRAGIDVRWLARSFELDSSGAVEMYMEATTGLERYWWHGGGRLTRPDFGAGAGLDVRAFKRPHLTVRFDFRVMFTPSDTDSALVACRGTCPATMGMSTAGLLGGMGVSW